MAYPRNRILQALTETNRFIDREEARGADLRPDSVTALLASYKAHRARLLQMLDAAA